MAEKLEFDGVVLDIGRFPTPRIHNSASTSSLNFNFLLGTLQYPGGLSCYKIKIKIDARVMDHVDQDMADSLVCCL